MRTNIDIDQELLRKAMKVTGASTKKAAVDAALGLAVQLHRQGEALEKLWGIGWEGNLDEMRENEHLDWDADWNANSSHGRSVA